MNARLATFPINKRYLTGDGKKENEYNLLLGLEYKLCYISSTK